MKLKSLKKISSTLKKTLLCVYMHEELTETPGWLDRASGIQLSSPPSFLELQTLCHHI